MNVLLILTRLEEPVSKGCADIKEINNLRYEKLECKKNSNMKNIKELIYIENKEI